MSPLNTLPLYFGKDEGFDCKAEDKPRSVNEERGFAGLSLGDLASGEDLDAEGGGGGGPIDPLVAFEVEDGAVLLSSLGVEVLGFSPPKVPL